MDSSFSIDLMRSFYNEATMIERNTEQYKVAEYIKNQFQDSFEILMNIDSENHFIGHLFPDIIFLDSVSKNPLFIIEIKRNGAISNCLNAWKVAQKVPATLYLVVPKTDLIGAKSIATVSGINVKFGYYEFDSKGNLLNVTFE